MGGEKGAPTGPGLKSIWRAVSFRRRWPVASSRRGSGIGTAPHAVRPHARNRWSPRANAALDQGRMPDRRREDAEARIAPQRIEPRVDAQVGQRGGAFLVG